MYRAKNGSSIPAFEHQGAKVVINTQTTKLNLLHVRLSQM